jgi:uncharacterized protein YjbJ (UPF0337 family)
VKNSIRWRKQNSTKRIVATEKLQELNLQSQSEFSGAAEISKMSGTHCSLFRSVTLCAVFKTYHYIPAALPGRVKLFQPITNRLKFLWYVDCCRANKEPIEEACMNWDQMKGNWKQFKGKAKEQWGKLTDDELDQVEGKRDQLVGRIQKQYGLSKEEAERQVSDWERTL